MSRLLVMLTAISAFGAFVNTASEALADPKSGREFAQRICAECHAVLPEDTTSRNAEAPAFKAIADNPFWTRTALLVWFQTPHPTMPNMLLDSEDLENVIAYILSLRDKS